MYLCLTNQKSKKMTLTQKQLKNVAEVSAIAGRLDELNKLEGYVPSALISRRKSILKGQLKELLGETEKKEEKTVQIHIEIPEEGRKVKRESTNFSSTLKKLLTGNFNEVEDDDDETLVVVKNLLPIESREVIGKVVREL